MPKIKCLICSKYINTSSSISRTRKVCSIKCRNINQSKIMKGKGNSMYGKHHTEETKEKMHKIMYGKYDGFKNPMYGTKRPNISKMMKNGGAIKAFLGNKQFMNKNETIVFNILKDIHSNFIYSGNKHLNLKRYHPDFIDEKNKLIIEVFGEYWHLKSDYKKRDKLKIKYYNKNGFKTLIIWGKETRDIPSLKQKIIYFINS